MAVRVANLAAALRELIAALDRRKPRHGHAGERAIARESAALRTEAVDRLADLTDEHPPKTTER